MQVVFHLRCILEILGAKAYSHPPALTFDCDRH